jgi:hemerythrin superfamily protein
MMKTSFSISQVESIQQLSLVTILEEEVEEATAHEEEIAVAAIVVAEVGATLDTRRSMSTTMIPIDHKTINVHKIETRLITPIYLGESITVADSCIL